MKLSDILTGLRETKANFYNRVYVTDKAVFVYPHKIGVGESEMWDHQRFQKYLSSLAEEEPIIVKSVPDKVYPCGHKHRIRVEEMEIGKEADRTYWSCLNCGKEFDQEYEPEKVN
jgi:hypothetical protein